MDLSLVLYVKGEVKIEATLIITDDSRLTAM